MIQELNIAEKKQNQGADATGILTAAEFNNCVTKVNELVTHANNVVSFPKDEYDVFIQQLLSRFEKLEDTITAQARQQPASMALDYPKKITQGNLKAQFIIVTLSPVGTGKNVLFLSDDRAVSVAPNGFLTVNGTGKSRIHVIPTENTAIYRTIEIEVVPQSFRLYTKTLMRFTGGGNLRFN